MGHSRARGLRTDAARRRSRRPGRQHLQLHRARAKRIGRHHPGNGRVQEIRRGEKLIVAGCLVERYRDQIREQMPEVDAVIGTGELERIIEAVRRRSAACFPLQPPAFPLSRPDAARPLHAAPCGLHQDRRRLRSSLHVLHHPAVSRQRSAAAASNPWSAKRKIWPPQARAKST